MLLLELSKLILGRVSALQRNIFSCTERKLVTLCLLGGLSSLCYFSDRFIQNLIHPTSDILGVDIFLFDDPENLGLKETQMKQKETTKNHKKYERVLGDKRVLQNETSLF